MMWAMSMLRPNPSPWGVPIGTAVILACIHLALAVPIHSAEPQVAVQELGLRGHGRSLVSARDGDGLRIVQVEPARLGQVGAVLSRAGASVLKVFPPAGLLVAGEGDFDSIDGVRQVFRWSGEVALTPELRTLAASTSGQPSQRVGVVAATIAETDLTRLSDRLSEAGARISWLETHGATVEIGINVEKGNLGPTAEVLADTAGLVSADVQPAVRLLNVGSAWRCQSGIPFVTPVFDNGLNGEDQVIAILDTGIDIDSCFFNDLVEGMPALNDDSSTAVNLQHRKVLATNFFWEFDWPNPGDGDWDEDGHGTHVAGSAAGDSGIYGLHDWRDGMAPAARLVIQDGGAERDNCADLPGLGCPLRPLEPVLEQTYLQGARIHSNSWGDEENFFPRGRYTERTADVDRFVWEHKDFLPFFAAGNSGQEGDGSVISPATGKNVVAVGATYHGSTEPLCPVFFSSRGWTQDGRIKPDILAPGTSIESAASDYSISTSNCNLAFSSGTSMATPTAAGLGALVRQYYADGYYPTGSVSIDDRRQPSAALVKATLIASAVDLHVLGCEETRPIPSPDQGWGLVQLDQALFFAGDTKGLYVRDRIADGFSSSSDPTQFTPLVLEGNEGLKVVLVWTDPPSSAAAETNLINDLDLVVSGPDGVFRGNVFSEGVSTVGGSADRLNNVEVVWLPQASPGRWTVQVSANSIAQGVQDFALVAVGALADDAPRPAGVRRGLPPDIVHEELFTDPGRHRGSPAGREAVKLRRR